MDHLISTVEDLQRATENVPGAGTQSIQRDMETLRDQWLEVRHEAGEETGDAMLMTENELFKPFKNVYVIYRTIFLQFDSFDSDSYRLKYIAR